MTTRKTWLVPAFFVVEADSESKADGIAIAVGESVNRGGLGALFLDEGLRTREIPGDDEPHTILQYIKPGELKVIK